MKHFFFTSIALRMGKWSFGLSECNTVNFAEVNFVVCYFCSSMLKISSISLAILKTLGFINPGV